MKLIRSAAVVVVLLFVAAAPVLADAYGAIAYSESTGAYGYSYGQPSRYAAESVALRNCRADDASIKVWVCNGYAALAVGDDGSWGYGWSTASRARAEAIALNNVSGSGARILCWVASGN